MSPNDLDINIEDVVVYSKSDHMRLTGICDRCGCECYEDELQDLYDPNCQEDRQYCPQCFTNKIEEFYDEG